MNENTEYKAISIKTENYSIKFYLKDLLNLLHQDIIKVDGSHDVKIISFNSLSNLEKGRIAFTNNLNQESIDIINKTKGAAIICNYEETHLADLRKDNAYILVKNPRLSFAKLLNRIYQSEEFSGFHPTATIHPEAKIGNNVTIGPYCIIGKCTIGDNSIIKGNNSIYDEVIIGESAIIHSGVVIGADGFGFVKDESSNEYFKFPHIGKVVIGDNVEIGANSSIDRATLERTVIGDGVKIASLVSIAHNVEIGKNCIITAGVIISGSTKIGEGVWIGPGSELIQNIKVGDNSTIGIGSVITKDIPKNTTYAGVPARPINDLKDLNKAFNQLINKK